MASSNRQQTQQNPEPTVQPVPKDYYVGAQNLNYTVVKSNIHSQSIKSIHVTCDNKYVVFGAMRKIYFHEIDLFETSRKQL